MKNLWIKKLHLMKNLLMAIVVILLFWVLGLGIIDLKGNPFGDDLPGIPSTTDTIVRRLDDIDPFGPPGGTGTIDIELVALSLNKIDPIDLSGIGLPGLFGDLYITINKDNLSQILTQPGDLPDSPGKMLVNHEDSNGGTFDVAFADLSDAGVVPPEFQSLLTPGGGVTALATLTLLGGDPANPLDVLFAGPAPRLTLWSTGTWEHDPFSDFFITSIEHHCPFPECHPTAYVPSPGGVAVLGLGGLMVLRRRR